MYIRQHICEDCKQMFDCVRCSETLEDSLIFTPDSPVLYHPKCERGMFQCDGCRA